MIQNFLQDKFFKQGSLLESSQVFFIYACDLQKLCWIKHKSSIKVLQHVSNSKEE